MKKKVIEGARKLIKKLFEAILDREAFIFEAPKAFTRNFSRDMLTDDQLEVIDSWKAAVRGQLNTAEKLHADKRGLADHGDTYFEMLPLPAPMSHMSMLPRAWSTGQKKMPPRPDSPKLRSAGWLMTV